MDDRQNRIKEYAFSFKNALIRLGPMYQHGKDGKKYLVSKKYDSEILAEVVVNFGMKCIKNNVEVLV